MNLTVNVATRGRPDLLKMTIEQSLPHMKREDTILMISVDDDDKSTIDSLDKLPKDPRLKFSIKPREDSRGEKYDRALTEYPADIYLPAVDCAPLITPGWDQIIIDAAKIYPDGIGAVYTPLSNYYFPGLQAFTAKLVEKMGYIYDHSYPFWFIDHDADDICRMIGRFVFVDIQFVNTQRPTTTIRMHHLDFWTRYYECMNGERQKKAFDIIDSEDFNVEPWQKILLKNQTIVTIARSTLINQFVLNDKDNIEKTRGDPTPIDQDPGYMRALQRAQERIKPYVQFQNSGPQIIIT